MEELYFELIHYLEPISSEVEFKALSKMYNTAEAFAEKSFPQGGEVSAAFTMMKFYLRNDITYEDPFQTIYKLFYQYCQNEIKTEYTVKKCVDLSNCREVLGYLTGIKNGLYRLNGELSEYIRTEMVSDEILWQSAFLLEEVPRIWGYNKEFDTFVIFLDLYVTKKIASTST